MEMKKVACAIVFAAASLSAVMAHGGHHHAPEPAVAPAAHAAHVEAPAPAPGPASGAAALGSMVGATLLSFVAYYLQF